jgi:hypothetical protein
MNEGLEAERRVFYGLFATHDQKEGMFLALSRIVSVYIHIFQEWVHSPRNGSLSLQMRKKYFNSLRN